MKHNKSELRHTKGHFLNFCHIDLVSHQANSFGAVPCYPFITCLPQHTNLCQPVTSLYKFPRFNIRGFESKGFPHYFESSVIFITLK